MGAKLFFSSTILAAVYLSSAVTTGTATAGGLPRLKDNFTLKLVQGARKEENNINPGVFSRVRRPART